MKKIILLFLACTFLLLTACKKDNNVTPSSDPSDSPSPQETSEASPTMSPSVSLSPSTPPSPITSETLRPANGTITIMSDGSEQPVDAKLVYQNLNSKNPFLAFSIYSDTEHFAYINDETIFRFVEDGQKTELSFLEISYITGIDAEGLKPSFADNYIDFTDITYASFSEVGEESMECIEITAFNNDQYLKAYLINVDFGVVAVVLSGISDSDKNTNRLSAMLDTLILHES